MTDSEIINLIEAELDLYSEWSPQWKAIYDLLGRVNTEIMKEPICAPSAEAKG